MSSKRVIKTSLSPKKIAVSKAYEMYQITNYTMIKKKKTLSKFEKFDRQGIQVGISFGKVNILMRHFC